jgi:hypothetical protein
LKKSATTEQMATMAEMMMVVLERVLIELAGGMKCLYRKLVYTDCNDRHSSARQRKHSFNNVDRILGNVCISGCPSSRS